MPSIRAQRITAKIAAHDHASWILFVEIYGPVVYRWLRELGLSEVKTVAVGESVFEEVLQSMIRDSDIDVCSFLYQTVHHKFDELCQQMGPKDALRHDRKAPERDTVIHDLRKDRHEAAQRARDAMLPNYSPRERDAFRNAVAGRSDGEITKDVDAPTADALLSCATILSAIGEIAGRTEEVGKP